MRIQGKLRLGYFPLPLTEARRIRACLRYPTSPLSAIDPCIGDAAAFLTITGESCARRYGIELDAYRAEQAATAVDELIHGDWRPPGAARDQRLAETSKKVAGPSVLAVGGCAASSRRLKLLSRCCCSWAPVCWFAASPAC